MSLSHLCPLLSLTNFYSTQMHLFSYLSVLTAPLFPLYSIVILTALYKANSYKSKPQNQSSLMPLSITNKGSQMERFHGYINPCYLDQKVDVRSLEVQGFAETQSFAFEEEEESLQDSVPFLQMLQQEEPNFLTLLSLQNLKESWELASYLSNEDAEFQKLSSMEGVNQVLSNQDMIIPSSSPPRTANSRRKRKISHLVVPEVNRERRRRRRKTKPSKNIEDIENQRINHIVVERNRRRQMNEHINSLRSLLPPSYIQRGDQASIVGGAINYVKLLEQFIQSLESGKRRQQNSEVENASNNNLLGISSNDLWTTQEDEACIPKIEAIGIQDHVKLKVQCPKKQGQLLKGIISLEKLRFTVLHLNIESLSHSSVSYSFNLKMEDDCDLSSADEIIAAAHQIFDVGRFD